MCTLRSILQFDCALLVAFFFFLSCFLRFCAAGLRLGGRVLFVVGRVHRRGLYRICQRNAERSGHVRSKCVLCWSFFFCFPLGFRAAGLRLRRLLFEVLRRVHSGRLVGEEVEGTTGAHARPARACYLGGSCRVGKSPLVSVQFTMDLPPVLMKCSLNAAPCQSVGSKPHCRPNIILYG